MLKIKETTMKPEQAADVLMSGVFVRRLSKPGEPSDPNVYLTINHDLGNETTTVQSVFTGKRETLSWDELEFYEDPEGRVIRQFSFSNAHTGRVRLLVYAVSSFA